MAEAGRRHPGPRRPRHRGRNRLPDRARGGRGRAPVRAVRPHHRAGPALQDPVRRADAAGAGAAAAEAGVRLPHHRGGHPHRVRGAAATARGRVGDADRRPERGGRGVDRPVPRGRSLRVPVQGAQPRGHVPRHERGDHAGDGRRPDRHGGRHGGPAGDRGHRRGASAGADRALSDGRHHRPGGAAGCQPARPRQAVLGRGQSGATAARPAHQRGAGRVQRGHPARPGRSGTDHPSGRGLCARPGEPRERRSHPVRVHRGRVSGGAQRDPAADVPGNDATHSAGGRTQGVRGGRHNRVLPLLSLDSGARAAAAPLTGATTTRTGGEQ